MNLSSLHLLCPSSAVDLGATIDELDVGEDSDRLIVLDTLNSFQIWVLMASINRKNIRITPIMAKAVLDKLPPHGEGIDIAMWVVSAVNPVTEDVVGKLVDLAYTKRELKGYEQVPVAIIEALAKRLF